MQGGQRTYYQILQVDYQATSAEIKSAYRRLARQTHPDQNQADPAAAEQFKVLAEAYRVLTNPKQRAEYDLRQSKKFKKPKTEAENPDLRFSASSFFKHLTSRAGMTPTSGSDLLYHLRLDLADVVRGGKFEIVFRRPQICEECRNGTTGQSCKKCRGSGRIEIPTRIEFILPYGIEDGSSFRFSEMGEVGTGGQPSGDLIVVVQIRPHPFFSLSHHQLHCRIPISFDLAVLGGMLQIPDLGGGKNIRVRIPAGAQTGQTLRLAHLGILRSRTGKRGDLLVSLFVEVPIKPNHHMKSLLRELKANSTDKHYPQTRQYHSWLDSLAAKNSKS